MAPKKQITMGIKVPPEHDWRTTDTDEINKRRLRGLKEKFEISNLDSRHPIFSNFRIKSPSGLTYSIEIRDIAKRQFACDCVDFRINGLGTCKHVEAVLLHVEARFRRLFQAAVKGGSTRIDIVPDRSGKLRVVNGLAKLPVTARTWFDANGRAISDCPERELDALQKISDSTPDLRISQEVAPWLETRRRIREAKALRHEYELKVQRGEWPAQETLVPLFPYQREGMLHLAFTERALLADEMGLGKTIQAIAACALLHRMGRAARVLVVTPASLKTEWEEQIQRFTALPYQLVFGPRPDRLKAYAKAPFFTIVNYEQMMRDALDVNERLQPDIIVLDEAQRIKNWSTKTSQAIKRLQSRYAFVLTGTPIENRIDEIHSLMDFLNPAVLGPLFRFNREYYAFDDRGRPAGYRNLDQLHARIKPHMLRRRKSEVETELPERTDRNHFVPLSGEQQNRYSDHEQQVMRLASIAKRRPLTQQEQDKLMRELSMMRMVCDSNYILNPNERTCPKIGELEKVLEECRDNLDSKVIIFSEWERMLELVRELCESLDLGFAWHTGTVPQRRRRAEINLFKTDPACRVFLSTDSGSTGLNLQNANVVINCDLPWNPAKLEQRIARAWRKHQTRPVTVINLVSENTIEHRMLDTLANKQTLADAVLQLSGNLTEIKLRSGRQAFLSKLEQIMAPATAKANGAAAAARAKVLPVDRALGFSKAAGQRMGASLVRCEERFPQQGAHSVMMIVVDRDPGTSLQKLVPLHQEFFGNGDPLAPVQLEVIDRATYEALERLAAAGLITPSTRATRVLVPADPCPTAPPPLSPEDQKKLERYRQEGARKLKVAKLLADGDMSEEMRAPLIHALNSLGRALAIENRLPEPVSMEETLLPPLAIHWKEHLPVLRRFLADESISGIETLKSLRELSVK